MVDDDPSRRDLLFGGMLLATAGAAILAKPGVSARPNNLTPRAFARAIPSRIGRYHRRATDEIVLPDRDSDSLTVYQQYVARTYAAPGLLPISMLIAYGAAQDYTLQVHRPESCYPPAGFALSTSHRLTLPGELGVPAIPAVTLTAHRIDRNDRLLYWTRVGDAFPDSLWRQRWVTMRALLGRHVPDGVLVRLSTADEGPEALAALIGFNALLLASIASTVRGLLLGSVSPAGSTA